MGKKGCSNSIAKQTTILAMSLGLCFVSCFDVRPVETPSSTNSAWVSPTDYQILLSNLRTALNQKNPQNYIRCFNRDKLTFAPAASLYDQHAAIWENWSVQDEQAYVDNLIGNLTGSSGGLLNLEELDLRDVSADSLRYVGNYRLEVRHNNNDIPQQFRGQVQWVIKINDFNEWEIHSWEDIETVPDSSWSLLKISFIQ